MNVSWNSAGPLTIAAEARRARVTPLGGTREVLNPEGLAQLMRPSSHAFCTCGAAAVRWLELCALG